MPQGKVVSVAAGHGPTGPVFVALDDMGVMWICLIGSDGKFLRWDKLPPLPDDGPPPTEPA